MEADPSKQLIFVNNQWLKQAISSKRKENPRHKFLFLIKGLHEVARLLTPAFVEWTNPNLSGKKRLLTPEKVGTTKKGKKTFGEAGNGVEECLLGGRMFHEKPRGGKSFEIARLTLTQKDKHLEILDSFVFKKKSVLKSFKPCISHLIPYEAKKSLHKTKGASLYQPKGSCLDHHNSEDIGNHKA